MHGNMLTMAVLSIFGEFECAWCRSEQGCAACFERWKFNGRIWGLQDVPVSEDCLDILRRVLVANPSQRLNMTQIRAHRWFRGSLPPGALEMNKFLINGFGPMDEVGCKLAMIHSMDAC